MREEGDGDDDGHTLPVTRSGPESRPANVGRDGAVELDASLDLVELVKDETVSLVTVGMVVCEGAERLGLLALTDEPTGRLGDEPDEEELEDRGDRLEDGGDTPCPLAVDPRRAESGPGSAIERKLLLGDAA